MTISATHFVIATQSAIFGVGNTVDEAKSHAAGFVDRENIDAVKAAALASNISSQNHCESFGEFYAAPATTDLAEYINSDQCDPERFGNIDGVFCTEEEQENEEK